MAGTIQENTNYSSMVQDLEKLDSIIAGGLSAEASVDADLSINLRNRNQRTVCRSLLNKYFENGEQTNCLALEVIEVVDRFLDRKTHIIQISLDDWELRCESLLSLLDDTVAIDEAAIEEAENLAALAGGEPEQGSSLAMRLLGRVHEAFHEYFYIAFHVSTEQESKASKVFPQILSIKTPVGLRPIIRRIDRLFKNGDLESKPYALFSAVEELVKTELSQIPGLTGGNKNHKGNLALSYWVLMPLVKYLLYSASSSAQSKNTEVNAVIAKLMYFTLAMISDTQKNSPTDFKEYTTHNFETALLVFLESNVQELVERFSDDSRFDSWVDVVKPHFSALIKFFTGNPARKKRLTLDLNKTSLYKKGLSILPVDINFELMPKSKTAPAHQNESEMAGPSRSSAASKGKPAVNAVNEDKPKDLQKANSAASRQQTSAQQSPTELPKPESGAKRDKGKKKAQAVEVEVKDETSAQQSPTELPKPESGAKSDKGKKKAQAVEVEVKHDPDPTPFIQKLTKKAKKVAAAVTKVASNVGSSTRKAVMMVAEVVSNANTAQRLNPNFVQNLNMLYFPRRSAITQNFEASEQAVKPTYSYAAEALSAARRVPNMASFEEFPALSRNTPAPIARGDTVDMMGAISPEPDTLPTPTHEIALSFDSAFISYSTLPEGTSIRSMSEGISDEPVSDEPVRLALPTPSVSLQGGIKTRIQNRIKFQIQYQPFVETVIQKKVVFHNAGLVAVPGAMSVNDVKGVVVLPIFFVPVLDDFGNVSMQWVQSGNPVLMTMPEGYFYSGPGTLYSTYYTTEVLEAVQRLVMRPVPVPVGMRFSGANPTNNIQESQSPQTGVDASEVKNKLTPTNPYG